MAPGQNGISEVIISTAREMPIHWTVTVVWTQSLPKMNRTDQFIYDPEDPVPTIGTMGPYDQRPVEERQDVLVYTTPPLKKNLEVTGPVKAVIFASSSAVNTDFTAKLVDVYPDGRAIRICEGIIRADHRDPYAAPSHIVPGKFMNTRSISGRLPMYF